MDRIVVYVDVNAIVNFLTDPNKLTRPTTLLLNKNPKKSHYEFVTSVHAFELAQKVIERNPDLLAQAGGDLRLERGLSDIRSRWNIVDLEDVPPEVLEKAQALTLDRHGRPDYEDAYRLTEAWLLEVDLLLTSDRAFQRSRNDNFGKPIIVSPAHFGSLDPERVKTFLNMNDSDLPDEYLKELTNVEFFKLFGVRQPRTFPFSFHPAFKKFTSLLFVQFNETNQSIELRTVSYLESKITAKERTYSGPPLVDLAPTITEIAKMVELAMADNATTTTNRSLLVVIDDMLAPDLGEPLAHALGVVSAQDTVEVVKASRVTSTLVNPPSVIEQRSAARISQ